MQKKNQKLLLMIIAVVILVMQFGRLVYIVNSIQGSARVINYAGIVRGATQRLVKNELYGKNDDSDIERLDDILIGLQTGAGTQKLVVLNDAEYKENLAKLADEWINVKKAIMDLRDNPDKDSELYTISEKYFLLADKTVTSAEVYADGIAQKMNVLEITIAINILLILAVLIIRIIMEIKNNKNLSQIAYVDIQTGLPNKRSCDQKLNDGKLIGNNQNVCCMMFDLNNLKVTNDTYGHEVGDALINSFASILRRNMPGDMFVGRFGGDEFIGIQMNADKDDILKRIEMMQAEASQTNNDTEHSGMNISFSWGFAFSSENTGCTIKSLMNIADKNMYVYKQATKKASEMGRK